MTRILVTWRRAFVAASIVFAATARAQQGRGDATFAWTRQLKPGSVLEIRNGDGPIRVNASPSDRVEVHAVKVRRGRNTNDVAFDVDESNNRVTICTIYQRSTSCRDRNRSVRGLFVGVEYTVLVPRDIRIEVTTGNGDVDVDGVGAGVTASTGRGHVFVTTGRGPISATSGAGDVDVRMQSLADNSDVRVTTGTGMIRVTLPSDFGGALDAQTANGTLRTDFDITLLGRLDSQHIRGTIGHGSALLRLQTGNGRIELRKN